MKEFKAIEGKNVIRMYDSCMGEAADLSKAYYIVVLQDGVVDDIEHGTSMYFTKPIQVPTIPAVKGFYRISSQKMWVRIAEINSDTQHIFNCLFKDYVTSRNKSAYYNNLFKHEDKLEDTYNGFLQFIYNSKDASVYKNSGSCVAFSSWIRGNLNLTIPCDDRTIIEDPNAVNASINKTMVYFLRYLREFYLFAASEKTPKVALKFANYKLTLSMPDDLYIRAIIRAV